MEPERLAAFFHVWARKEAVAESTGLGLSPVLANHRRDICECAVEPVGRRRGSAGRSSTAGGSTTSTLVKITSERWTGVAAIRCVYDASTPRYNPATGRSSPGRRASTKVSAATAAPWASASALTRLRASRLPSSVSRNVKGASEDQPVGCKLRIWCVSTGDADLPGSAELLRIVADHPRGARGGVRQGWHCPMRYRPRRNCSLKALSPTSCVRFRPKRAKKGGTRCSLSAGCG